MHAYIVLVLHLGKNLVNVCEAVERKKDLKVIQAGYLDNYQVLLVVWKMEDGKMMLSLRQIPTRNLFLTESHFSPMACFKELQIHYHQ